MYSVRFNSAWSVAGGRLTPQARPDERAPAGPFLPLRQAESCSPEGERKPPPCGSFLPDRRASRERPDPRRDTGSAGRGSSPSKQPPARSEKRRRDGFRDRAPWERQNGIRDPAASRASFSGQEGLRRERAVGAQRGLPPSARCVFAGHRACRPNPFSLYNAAHGNEDKQDKQGHYRRDQKERPIGRVRSAVSGIHAPTDKDQDVQFQHREDAKNTDGDHFPVPPFS